MNAITTLSGGSAILIVTFFIGSVLSFIFTVSMGWLLTPAEYGMFGVSQALLALAGLFAGSAFPWVMAKFMAEPARQNKNTVFRSSLLANIGLAFLPCVLLYLSYKFRLLPLEDVYQPLIFLVMIYILIASVGGIYQGSLQGLLRFKQLGITRCIYSITLLISSIILVLLGLAALGAVAGFVVAALVSLILYIYYTRDQKFWRGGSWINKEVYVFAVPMFLGVMSAQLLTNVAILGVKFFIPGMSDIMAGYYRASLAISRIPVYLIIAIMGAFLPFISYYAGNKGRVENYSVKTVKYALVFILPICLTTFAIPESLITLIFPQSYIAGAPALRILSIGMFLLVLSYIYGSVFQGVGKPKVPALIMLGAIAIQVACLYFLVPRYGLIGAAISTTLACSFAFILLLYVYLRHYRPGLSMIDLGKIALASIMLFFILYFFPMPTRVLTVAGLLCGLGVFLAILAVTGVLHYTDTDILLSGIFNDESKFKARLVKLVKLLNKENKNVTP